MNVLNRVTMKTLRRNRARTVVTIIGVILSAAMFTAVTTFISTMQHYMLASVLSTQGSWHAQLAGLPYDAAGQLRDDPKIKAVAVQQEIGYARLPESQNDYKPYWYIQALDDGSAALLAGLPDVEEYAVLRGATGTVRVPREALSPRLLQNGVLQEDGDGYYTLEVTVQAFGESAFSAYLKRLGLDPAAYRDPEAPKAVVQDAVQYYHDGKRQIDRLFSKAPSSLEITGRISSGESEEEDAGQAVTLPLDIGAATDAAPIGSDAASVCNHIFVYVSDEVYDRTIAGWDSAGPRRLYFTAKGDASKLSEEIRKTLAGNGILQYSLTDIAEMTAINRNMLLVVNVFSYGFIVLISLITTANVLNTISTNINLRRREFAMLKSVGITPGGFNRMMNFECIFYGLKALLYGLPLSLLATYLIYLSMSQGLGMAFTLPWTAILIASASVFLVVFVTMMYSMSKIKKENIVDALNNENL